MLIQLPPRRDVTSLQKALYDNYLCLEFSNKQQINLNESNEKLGNGQ